MAESISPRDGQNGNVMLSASGRRVGLLRLLERSLRELDLPGRVIATDVTLTSAAMQATADRIIVPRYSEPGCLEFLLKLCTENQIGLIVPTIDTELAFYERNRAAFAARGTQINVSDLPTVEIGGDKQRTHEWLTENAIPTVRQVSLGAALNGALDWEYPVLVKPRFGSSSIGITKAKSRVDLEARAGEKDLLVQSIATGREYTVDVFIDRSGKCRCAVPRLRLETRGGEVSKGMTVRNPAVIELASRVAEALPGGRGVLNVQIFHDDTSGVLAVIEVNPRFGGGYPLSHEAGAAMTTWLLEETFGLPCSARSDAWQDGLVMLRYDEAVFVSRQEARVSLK